MLRFSFCKMYSNVVDLSPKTLSSNGNIVIFKMAWTGAQLKDKTSKGLASFLHTGSIWYAVTGKLFFLPVLKMNHDREVYLTVMNWKKGEDWDNWRNCCKNNIDNDIHRTMINKNKILQRQSNFFTNTLFICCLHLQPLKVGTIGPLVHGFCLFPSHRHTWKSLSWQILIDFLSFLSFFGLDQ